MRFPFRKMFLGDIRNTQKDVAQNIYAFRFLLLCLVILTGEILLNELNIFIVDKAIFRCCYFLDVVIFLLYLPVLYCLKFSHPMTKYINMTVMLVMISIAVTALTYHMLLTIMVPIIIAGMYESKKFMRYTILLSLLSITISTYLGYYLGICDANMVLLTATSLKNLNQNGTFILNQVNPNPTYTILMYYVFPRCLMLMAFTYVSIVVNSVIRKSRQEATQDSMTGLYNKNKFLELINNNTYRDKEIAVIYWDVNKLKYVNDNFGHSMGDQLITKIAQTIKISIPEDAIAIRYGGDEFIAILSSVTKTEVESIILKWENIVKQIQNNVEYPISAAVGYSMGHGDSLKQIVSSADEKMYFNKEQLRI